MTPPEHARRLPKLGHTARLKLHPTARFLITAQLVVFALSLEDEEIVALMAEGWDLGPRATALSEAGITFILLAAWAALTLGWVRFARAFDKDRRP